MNIISGKKPTSKLSVTVRNDLAAGKPDGHVSLCYHFNESHELLCQSKMKETNKCTGTRGRKEENICTSTNNYTQNN